MGANIKSTTQPFIKASINFQKSKARNRISVAPEIGLSFFNTTGTKPDPVRNNTATYDIKNTYLELGINAKYYFNPMSKQRIFIGAGLNANLRIAGKNTYNEYNTAGTAVYTTNEPEEPRTIFLPSVSLGCNFKKFDIFTNYEHFSNMLTHSGSKWTVNRISFGFSYFLYN